MCTLKERKDAFCQSRDQRHTDVCRRQPACARWRCADESGPGVRAQKAMDTNLADLDEETRGAVKSILLRRSKEAGLSKDGLQAASRTDARLQRLASLSKKCLGELKEHFNEVFKDTGTQHATGLPSFAELVSKLVWLAPPSLSSRQAWPGLKRQCVPQVRTEAVMEEELEALVENARCAVGSACW